MLLCLLFFSYVPTPREFQCASNWSQQPQNQIHQVQSSPYNFYYSLNLSILCYHPASSLHIIASIWNSDSLFRIAGGTNFRLRMLHTFLRSLVQNYQPGMIYRHLWKPRIRRLASWIRRIYILVLRVTWIFLELTDLFLPNPKFWF